MPRRLEIWLAMALLGCHFRIGSVPVPDGGARQPPRDLATAPAPLDLDLDFDLAGAPDLAPAPPLVDLAQPPDLLPLAGEIDIGAAEAIPAKVDLTGEGMIDWAHFGMNVAGKDDHRASGADTITIGAIGATLTSYGFYMPSYQWKDGTPNKNGNTSSGVYVSGVGHAITITVPAGRALHTLRLYLTNYQSTAQLSGHLSDGSIADATGPQLTAGVGNVYYRVTIPFHAGSDGQMLTMKWTMTDDAGGGSVDVMAATLY